MRKVYKAILIVAAFIILIVIGEITVLIVNYSSVESRVDRNLKTIMSSPLYSSNSDDYIKEHQEEFDSIISMKDKALNYMYSLFEKDKDNGLKGAIMAKACIAILGDRNKVTQYMTPMDWYQQQTN